MKYNQAPTLSTKSQQVIILVSFSTKPKKIWAVGICFARELVHLCHWWIAVQKQKSSVMSLTDCYLSRDDCGST